MDGMTGKHYRGLINRLVSLLDAPNYLEIGSWKGSSACAAMHGNRLQITCIDNWSEFGGPRNAFLENVERCRSDKIARTRSLDAAKRIRSVTAGVRISLVTSRPSTKTWSPSKSIVMRSANDSI